MHGHDLLISLTLIIVLGITTQWFAWRIKTPAILLLLIVGIIAGPVTNILDVEHTLGDLLFPLVSLSVALILFEGGLSLRWSDLKDVGDVVRNIISIGAGTTWILSSLAAHFLLGLDWRISFLLGAILVVTGPTVVLPLLNQIRPTRRAASVLRWEGIVIDPVGAVLAVLIFEEILASEADSGIVNVAISVGLTLVIGLGIGWLGARFLTIIFSRFYAPDHLQNPITMLVVLGSFTLSNVIQSESGLLTVTMMGIFLANQHDYDIDPITEFQENIQILLLSSLFILLAARLNLEDIENLGFSALAFVGTLMFIVRPISVWVSSLGSGLTWREKLFISWLAPRGIVAASVSSIFALELVENGYEGAEVLVPITFTTIILTVAIYSLTAKSLANRLGLSELNPQGVLIIGSHDWARMIAKQIHDAGFRAIVSDTNYANIHQAEALGLEVLQGNILHMESIDLNGIGRIMSLTSNDMVNSLMDAHFRRIFGSEEVYQLFPQEDPDAPEEIRKIGGRKLFDKDTHFDELTRLFINGAEIHQIKIDAKYKKPDVQLFIPLFVVKSNHQLMIWTPEEPPKLENADILYALVNMEEFEPVNLDEVISVEVAP